MKLAVTVVACTYSVRKNMNLAEAVFGRSIRKNVKLAVEVRGKTK